MRKTGLVFEEKDLKEFRTNGAFELLLLPPGFSRTVSDTEAITGIHCLSLSEFVEKGEISRLSTQVAPAIRSLMSRIRSDSIEAKSSQGDLYQYHLRLQWLYVVALDRFFDTHPDVDLWFALEPYQIYDSPMRPEAGVLYSNSRLLAYLASKLAHCKGMKIRTLIERNPQLVRVVDTTRRISRKVMFKLLLSIKLVQKVLRARRRSDTLNALTDSSPFGSVGIIVRTDSEVTSASHLIQSLLSEGIPFCVIHDEMISSTTTLKRLESMGIKSVSVGSMLGLTGVLRAWCTLEPRLTLDAPTPELTACSHPEQVLLRNEDVLSHLKARLHDFHSIQLNFRLELNEIICRYRLGLLVTYAYIDQWGGVIKAAGDQFGIKTFAIQNAAQDPEEFPRFGWADFYCVESQYLKQKLLSLGYPSEKLAATGLPHFSSVDSRLLAHKDLDMSKKQLLILAQPIYKSYFEAVIGACASFAKKNDFFLAIKYHPRQRGNEYDEFIQKNVYDLNIQIYQQEPLDEIITKSSAVISIVSAALIRSINLGTPTISFFPMEEQYLDLYYANNSNLYCVSSIQQLTDLLELMSNDELAFRNGFETRRSNYLKEHTSFEPTDNPNANIMNYLLKILRGVDSL
jgi:hypothetical protein